MKIKRFAGVVKAVRSKYVDVDLAPGQTIVVALSGRKLRIGDPVTVIIEESAARRVFVSVVLPVLLTGILFMTFYNGTGDVLLSGIMAGVALGPYFSLLIILKDPLFRTVRLQ